MDIYDYSDATGELLAAQPRLARVCPGREDWPDDQAGKFLIPANATTVAPPAAQAGHAVCFQAGAWVQIEDHRGATYYEASGKAVTITGLGPVDASLSATEPPPPPPVSADVDRERDRRISLGFVFQTVAYQTRLDKGDFENISGMGALAIEALRDGTGTAANLRWFDPDNDFGWIANDNSVTPMDAPTMVAFGKAAAMHKSAHIFAASQIKKLNPIPADYATNAAYWP